MGSDYLDQSQTVLIRLGGAEGSKERVKVYSVNPTLCVGRLYRDPFFRI